ncbi:uncharacterized protein AKAME5_001922200 [Lates japonicus]|uniref:Uncharacterized protein n=1 Tax=Lates japonicus TaxID=270547 RepID=A0AAD3N8U1_LATJO|nr:uncharacterized protein AKAME5_001922200 [Lates japonicus]
MSRVFSSDFLPPSEVKKETDLDQTSQDQITNKDQTSDQDQIINLDQTYDQSPTSEDQTSEDETSEDQTSEDETSEDQTSENQIIDQEETSEQDQTSNQDQTTDPLTQQAALMLFLEEKVLFDHEEEDLISAKLSSFIDSLEDREWQSLQDRMVEQMSQTHLAQVSERIIRVVSQLVLQLLAPALKVQFQPEDLLRAPPSEREEEEEEHQSDNNDRQSGPGQRDTMSRKEATEEVMFAIADTMSSCQVEGEKVNQDLRDLAAKISEQCSASSHQQPTITPSV